MCLYVYHLIRKDFRVYVIVASELPTTLAELVLVNSKV